jgi:hypothetical protein
MCNRRKPIKHISGHTAYRFSDVPVLLEGDECVADGRIWLSYTCEHDDDGWDVDWEYDNFDELDVYAPDGEPILLSMPDSVYDQIKTYLDLQPRLITEAVYDHAINSI